MKYFLKFINMYYELLLIKIKLYILYLENSLEIIN